MTTPGDDQSSVVGFKRHLRVTTVPGEGAYLASPRGTFALSGGRIDALAPLLDGRRTLQQIEADVADVMGAGELHDTLDALAGANVVGARPAPPAGGALDEVADAAAAYWDLARLEPPPTSAVRLLVTAAAPDADAAVGALRSAGLPVTVDAADAGPVSDASALRIVVCDDYLDPELAAVNARALAGGWPWLLARVTGPDLWVGPFLRPGAGPCWSCLATRLRGHRRAELRTWAGVARPPEASLPCTRALGWQVLALEAAKWLAGARGVEQDTVWTMDTVTLATARHPVTRRPQCGDCGDPSVLERIVRQPVRLRSRAKTADGGNGHRAVPTREVWQRLEHLRDPVTGIVGQIRRDPRCPDWLHSYLAGENLAIGDAAAGGLRQQSSGKGASDREARVGALCEAVERYCGTWTGDEPTVRDTLRGLGAVAVSPQDCQLFDARQFARRREWNATAMPFHRVPDPVGVDEPLDWTSVWSLTADRPRLLPTDLLYFGRDGHGGLRADSNGNAAGGSTEDAILQGLLELVERDAVGLWWYNRTCQPGVDLDSFDDPWIDGLRSAYADLSRVFWVLDLTADLEVPVMAAVSRRTDGATEDLMLGFGAHLDPAVALRRAVSELGQLLPAALGPRASGAEVEPDEWVSRWWRTATLANQPYLRPDPAQPARTRACYGYVHQPDLRTDVEHLVRVAADRGLETLVLDQTRPDIELPVVKVVVPGMRHFWPRFAPGRLFDVPVQLGRLAAPTAYDRLNPIPLFL